MGTERVLENKVRKLVRIVSQLRGSRNSSRGVVSEKEVGKKDSTRTKLKRLIHAIGSITPESHIHIEGMPSLYGHG